MNLSFSASQKYITSPMSYFLHYFLRLRPVTTGSALAFGGALDEGFNILLNAIKNGNPPSLPLAKEIFKAAFAGENNQVSGALKYSKADLDLDLIKDVVVPEGHAPEWYSLAEKGQIMIEAYFDQIIPRIEEVLAVQHEINLPNQDGDVLTGIVDFIARIDGKVYLCDNKSTSIAYKEGSANESAQLATYYEALREEFGLEGVAYITISKKLYKKKLPQVATNIILGSVSEELLDKTFRDYDAVLGGIKMGKFPCTRNQRDGCCSVPWGCSYLQYCRTDGKDTAGLMIQPERKK